MNSYLVGQFVGSIIGIVILGLIIRLVLKRFLTGNMLIVVTVFSAVVVATIIYTYGGAGSASVRFGEAIVQYTMSGIIVVALWLLKARFRDKKDG